jgi:ZIP family zinc transporter
MMRTGMFTALAITIHNFPEGIATFATALTDINLGVVIAFAIALHNIPEGISVSVPLYCATGSKKTALKYSFISGLAEPLGAVIAYLVLMPFLNDAMLAVLLACVAGIMVYISVDEIIPAAYSYGKSHIVVIGVVMGMAIMAASLLML